MILSDTSITSALAVGNIVIKPFLPECLGSNSYDVHLGKTLAFYVGGGPNSKDSNFVLDAKAHNPVHLFEIPDSGYVLQPGTLYLGVTEEYTETHGFVPFIEGKSSTGRLGLSIHATAGKGDAGFKGYWTLEMTVTHPVRVYAGMPIGQIIYYAVQGYVARPYDKKSDAKYSDQANVPVESMMWKNKF